MKKHQTNTNFIPVLFALLFVIILTLFTATASLASTENNNTITSQSQTNSKKPAMSDVCPESDIQRCVCSFNAINFDKAVRFAKKVQQLIRNDDKKTLATLVEYPLRINKKPGLYYFINNKTEFIQQYKSIFSVKLKKHILMDNPPDVFCNYQGGAAAAGSYWFNDSLQEDDSIFVINLP